MCLANYNLSDTAWCSNILFRVEFSMLSVCPEAQCLATVWTVPSTASPFETFNFVV